MGRRRFWCRQCGQPKELDLPPVEPDEPSPTCAACGGQKWSSEHVTPQVTENDKQFLKSLKISWK